MQKWFDSTLQMQDLVVDPGSAPPDAREVRQAMRLKLQDYGVVILDGRRWADPRAMQLRLAKVFGEVGRHNRANANGLVMIAPLAGYTDYLGASHHAHPLHTDGPFESVQPRFMSMLCDRQADQGGETTLASSKAAYLYLLEKEPTSLARLFDPDALFIERAGQAASIPMFRKMGQRISLAFRYDDVVSVRIKPEGQAAFEALLEFIQNPAHIAQFSLPPHFLLIADNGSVLHGRRSFAEGETRRMWRLNLNGGADPAIDAVLGFEP